MIANLISLISSKAAPWIAGGLVVFIAGLIAAVYVLHSQNGSLNEQIGSLVSERQQLIESHRQQANDNQRLHEELAHRDVLVTRTVQAKQAAERNAREVTNQLRQALATDACAATRHPGAVADSLRPRAADSVQD